jgi:4-hydroxybenzoate polyprenyltransferase
LGKLVILLSFGALFLAVTYPFTKRFFALPQAYLGIAFGFGIPMAYAAETDSLPASAWILLVANIFWTMVYDTEYAMVDREDDRKIGIRTSAILLGRFDVAAVMVCYTAFLAIMTWLGWSQHLAWPYHAGLLCALGLGVYQYVLIRERDPLNCFRAFFCNNWVGAAIFGKIVLAYLLQNRA